MKDELLIDKNTSLKSVSKKEPVPIYSNSLVYKINNM